MDGAGSALPCSSRTIAENQTPSSRRRSATSSRSSGADRLRARRRPWPRTRNGAFLALRCRQARHMRRAAAASRHSAAASCPGPGWSRKVQAPPSSSRPSRADSGAAPRAAPMLIRLGTLATKRRNRVASSSLAPAGQGACGARRDHRLSPWPASSRRLSHCVSSALTMRLACRSRSSSSARERSAIRW